MFTKAKVLFFARGIETESPQWSAAERGLVVDSPGPQGRALTIYLYIDALPAQLLLI